MPEHYETHADKKLIRCVVITDREAYEFGGYSGLLVGTGMLNPRSGRTVIRYRDESRLAEVFTLWEPPDA